MVHLIFSSQSAFCADFVSGTPGALQSSLIWNWNDAATTSILSPQSLYTAETFCKRYLEKMGATEEGDPLC